MAKQLRWTLNRFHSKRPADLNLSPFQPQTVDRIREFLQSHPAYQETPIHSLKHLAKHLNIHNLIVKDESLRFGLNAFKGVGGLYAMGRVVAERAGLDVPSLSFSQLLEPEVQKKLGELTFISATDGNHGRGVAWVASELGQKSKIFMPKGSSISRLSAIQELGAEVQITDTNYDETVRMCADMAKENDWIIVQDTSWTGYEEIPLWIMQGYSVLAAELFEQLQAAQMASPTHIILQAGVGSFAASVAAYFTNRFPEHSPRIILVEPGAADCFFRSFTTHDGHMEEIKGDLATIMAGLSCGVPNPYAYRLLKNLAHASFSCADSLSALGSRVLGNPLSDDHRIISGESGSIPIGLLYYLRTTEEGAEICKALSIDDQSRILCISTEGDTDPSFYRDIVWKGYHSNLPAYSEIIK
ncbi:diaminopropionate ammonia-lyase [Sporosarcina sp. Te-1]|uniref:diaminopropionate ammonia-lyase n=1 Tax=Sporosarcina sp. Te-1 TaxID=2818390 RepID=UPI001A9F0430|nr:diaminopropionate ammonia-lyase [Sporosarcina sp. Te-1]QTD42551.1 diaminopropionate ammonia-lyase [Sporosarcina sp. Te-1]